MNEKGIWCAQHGKNHTSQMACMNEEQERKEDIEDFKNLVPMHIRMNTVEFEWFMSKIAAEDEENIPNLKALEKHRPHGFKDLK